MKHTKRKKKRSGAPKSAGNDVAGKKVDEECKAIDLLMEAFVSVSLEEATSAYREANGDPNKAAEILGGLPDNTDDPSTSSSTSTSSSSGLDSSSSSMSGLGSSSSSSEGIMEANAVENIANGHGFRGSKGKRVIAATGTVSTVLGKDYVMSTRRKESMKSNAHSNKLVDKEEAEQFLCSMLGDSCELNMAVVRDVLRNCGYDVEKALDALLNISASSHEESRNVRLSLYNANCNEDARVLVEHIDGGNITDRTSDSTSHSSENELQDNFRSVGYGFRSYSEVLATPHTPTSPRITKSDLPQKVLESLFNVASKTPEHEPGTMNWKNVVKKMESLGPRFDSYSSSTDGTQQNNHVASVGVPKGEEYHVLRKDAQQHWASMKSYYQRAATAYTRGEREYASFLSEQGYIRTKMARNADEKASQDIFKARNKSIENVITIDLHGQHVKQAMRLLKLHLLFGSYASSIHCLRVITGCGSHGVGKSKLKQLVINIVENEGVEWSEENQGTVLIKLDGQRREFSFLDSDDSDTE